MCYHNEMFPFLPVLAPELNIQDFKACEFFSLFPQVLGGIEPSLYRGDIWYTPIKEEWYYQVEILKLEVGGQNLELDCREVFAIDCFCPYKTQVYLRKAPN